MRVRGASFAWPGRILFSDVNATLHSGELIHLRGANGTGKSTFLRICAGLLEPAKGQIEMGAAGFDYLPAENNGFHLKLGATENLRFWRELRSASECRDEEIQAILARWNLSHPLVAGTGAFIGVLPVGKFSTGMKRRLALARLELNNAGIWLLDEPVSGLDEEAVATFKDALHHHLDSGGGAVVISHDTRIFSGMNPVVLDIAAARKGKL
jgi:heme exporter protein A